VRPDGQAESVVVDIRTPAAVLGEVVAAIAVLRQGGELDPQPWLWAEQAADLAAGSATAAAVTAMEGLTRRLAAWSAGVRPAPPGPGLNDLAWRDPVDGSVQPYRLHLPAGSGPFPVVLLLPTATHVLARLPTRSTPSLLFRNVAATIPTPCLLLRLRSSQLAGATCFWPIFWSDQNWLVTTRHDLLVNVRHDTLVFARHEKLVIIRSNDAFAPRETR